MQQLTYSTYTVCIFHDISMDEVFKSLNLPLPLFVNHGLNLDMTVMIKVMDRTHRLSVALHDR